MDNSNVLPTGNYIYSLEFKAPSSKQTSEIITQHSTANLEIEPTISIEENTNFNNQRNQQQRSR